MKREHELKNLTSNEKLDVLFLVETDTTVIKKGEDYIIIGYKTISTSKKDENGIIVFVRSQYDGGNIDGGNIDKEQLAEVPSKT